MYGAVVYEALLESTMLPRTSPPRLPAGTGNADGWVIQPRLRLLRRAEHRGGLRIGQGRLRLRSGLMLEQMGGSAEGLSATVGVGRAVQGWSTGEAVPSPAGAGGYQATR